MDIIILVVATANLAGTAALYVLVRRNQRKKWRKS